MKYSCNILTLLALSTGSVFSQDVTVPDTCIGGYQGGTDEVIYTLPYTYAQVMSIIGSYKNLTWSGNPDNTVTLNGTDNTVGTARTYDIVGAHVIETILVYQKPANGPYYEVHNTYNLTVPSYNVSFYIPYDATTVTSICDGRASTFNFTARYCGSNGTVAGQVLHAVHMADAIGAGQLLGGQNFTSCDALGSTSSATGASSTSSGGGPATYTGAASALEIGGLLSGAAGLAVIVGLAIL